MMLSTLPNIVTVIKSRWTRWVGHVACIRETRNTYELLTGRAQGERPVGMLRNRWEDIIKMDIGKIICEDVN